MRLLAIALLIVTFSCKNSTPDSNQTEIETTKDLVKIELKIDGMTCTGCEGTIEANISSLEGVAEIDAVHTSGSAQISADISTLDTTLIKETVEAAGYHVVSIAILE